MSKDQEPGGFRSADLRIASGDAGSNPTILQWQLDEALLPGDWAGHVYIEADEESGIASAHPVTDMPHMDRPLFTFACPDGDTRLVRIQLIEVVAYALLSLRDVAVKRGLVSLKLETCSGDDLIVALQLGKSRIS